MYVLGMIIGAIFYKKTLKKNGIEMKKQLYEDLIFHIMLGVIIGGRLGYVLFYDLPYFATHPLQIFAVWKGGMSFHGGALGVIIFGLRFAKKNKYNFYKLADPVMPFIAIGLGLGRLANFINGELYGRVTDLPWGMVFPTAPDRLPRHPSQLYEMFLEGILLAIILFIIFNKTKIHGLVFWSFIGLYGVFRFLVEFVRQPDAHLGFILGFLTMGQILSLFMIVTAIIAIFILIYKKQS